MAGKFAGPAAGVLAVGAGALTAYEGSKDVDEKVKKGELTKDEGTVKKSEAIGTGAGQAIGGAGGAALGAAIGTAIFPVVGTVIGAAVGGWLFSKGGEIVGEKVGKSVGKSLVDKPKTDTSAVSVSDIQANMAKGMSQKDAQKAAEEKAAKTPVKNAESEDPKNMQAKLLATLGSTTINEQDKAKFGLNSEDMKAGINKPDKIQDPILLLSKSLGLNTAALEQLTASINSMPGVKTTQLRTGMPGGLGASMGAGMGSMPSKGGGTGISTGGGMPSMGGGMPSMGASMATGLGGGGIGINSSMVKTSSKTAPSVGSSPSISFPSMSAGGTDGGADGKTGTGTTDLPKVATAKGSAGSLDEKAIKDMIIKHEGKVNKPYKDSLGLWTVGVGHLIGDGKSLPDAWNREFSDEEVMKLFDEDYNHHRQAAEKISGFDKFNSAGQGALTDLTFNMGPNWTSRFPNTAKQIAKGNAEGAAAGLQDSKWYTQVGKRAPEVVGLISQGGIQAKDGGLADGPVEGYPATLHGNEAILPLNPDSIITKLLNTSEAQITKEMNNNITTNNTDTEDKTSQIMADLYTMMEEKFDAMIEALEDGNDHTEKLVKFSAV